MPETATTVHVPPFTIGGTPVLTVEEGTHGGWLRVVYVGGRVSSITFRELNATIDAPDSTIDHIALLSSLDVHRTLTTQQPPARVTASRKDCAVVGTATATVEATDATYDQVLDAGLIALRETRSSLFGYGIKQLRRDEAPALLTGTFVVYADRD